MQLKPGQVWFNVWCRGWEARHFGKPETANPHTANSENFHSWAAGWQDADEDIATAEVKAER